MSEVAFPKRTKTDIVCTLLKDDIASGFFIPGARLDEAALASRYGVSRTPIREALSQLAAIGMITRHAHRGCHVAPQRG